MKKILAVSVSILLLQIGFTQVKVQNLLVENLSNPIGMDITSPRLSWQLASDKRNTMQTAYEIRVGTAVDLSSQKGFEWSSGKINSDSSVHVVYKGKPLQPGKKYFWQVRVWDNEEKASAWSETASWQMGLLDSNEWKAKWIESDLDKDADRRPAIYFRKEFRSSKKIQSATAYITAHGLYEAMINGKRVGDFI